MRPDAFYTEELFEVGKEWPVAILVQRYAWDEDEQMYDSLPFDSRVYYMEKSDDPSS
jgi:hypothetical protein